MILDKVENQFSWEKIYICVTVFAFLLSEELINSNQQKYIIVARICLT